MNIIISPVLAQNVDYWISQGKTLYNQVRSTEAVDAYNKALAIEPNNIDALYGKAVALTDYYNLTKSGPTWVKLKEEIDKLMISNPNDAQTWVYKGDRLLFWGASDTDGINSEQAYDKALSIDPNNVRALIGKGNYKLGTQQYQEAITFFDRALAIDSNNVDALHGKGRSLAGQRSDEAITVLDKAIALDPTNVNILGSKTNALVQLQRNSEAIPVMEKAISINPNSYRLWVALGHVFYFNCQFEESVQAYRKALTLNPPSDMDIKLLQDEITKIESKKSLPNCSTNQPSGQQVTTRAQSNQNQAPGQTSTPLSISTLVVGIGLGGMVYLFRKKRM